MTTETLDAALRSENAASIRAILPVHLNGQCCDMPAVAERAQKAGVMILKTCHVLGGAYTDGEPVGNCTLRYERVLRTPVSYIGEKVESLHPQISRTTTAGSQPRMERDQAQFINPEQAFAPNGEANPWYYEMQDIGSNYRASDIHCALGLSQLTKLDTFVSTQNKLAEYYKQRLQGLAPIVQPIKRTETGIPAWHVSVALIDFEKAGLIASAGMRLQKVFSQVLYCLYRQLYYERLWYTAVGRRGGILCSLSMSTPLYRYDIR